jgi:hypothetical protein
VEITLKLSIYGEKFMNVGLRADIAYIVARMVSNQDKSAIYDFSRSKHIMISGEVSLNNINIYDHDRMCHITGSKSGDTFSLYDFGLSSHINLSVKNSSFDGYDFNTSSHFNGSFTGNVINLYDFETSNFYQFNL